MVRAFSFHPKGDTFCSITLGIGMFACVTFLVALCAKHAKKISRKYMHETSDPKVTPSHNKNNNNKNSEGYIEEGGKSKSYKNQEKLEEGGLWQKAILMGEKCQPPDFSGVIYYDPHGNRISELPRTPYRTLTPHRGSSLADFISVRV
ncbi:hypothetical protein Leryth_025896 [Lithospermum erythrorhizon]|nr:hypothetical protein Leryth_025896 [Lithospermum erythrorhizon]